jgi:dTDP-L-rhamnose 4-epimerase
VYGRTKLAAEQLAEQFAAAGGRVVVVRPQNVIGPGPAVHNPYTGVLMAFAARLRHGLPPQVYAPGRQTRDFVAVQDVAAAIVWLLEHVEAWADCPVMNLGTGARVTLCELAALACRAAGAPVAFDLVDVLRPGDIDDACADLSLARRTGLPTPRVPLAESVRAFMAFAAEQEPVDPQIWQAALDESSGAPAGRS